MNKKVIFLIITAVFSLMASYAVFAWTEPPMGPPSNPAGIVPLNIGGVAQTKSASIGATQFIDADDPTYWVKPSGVAGISALFAESVGIGTASPISGYSLDIYKSTGNALVQIESDELGARLHLDRNAANSGSAAVVMETGGAENAAIGLDNDNTNNFYIGDSASFTNKFLTINTSSGDVGIGTTDPAEKLEVNGAVNLGNTSNNNIGTIKWTGTDFEGNTDGTAGGWVSLTASGAGFIDGIGTANFIPKWQDPDTLTNSVIRESGGMVGIGMAPDKALSVNGNLRLQGDGVYGAIYGPSTPGLTVIEMRTNDEVHIHIDEDQDSYGAFIVFDDRDNDLNGTKDIIFYAGEINENYAPNFVGVLGMPPTSRLYIGDTDTNGPVASQPFIEVISPSGSPDFLALSSSDAAANHGNIMMVKNSGYVGIGVSSPTYRLQLPNIASSAGRGYANAWISASSRRWKEDIKPLEDALGKVLNLQGVSFNWKESGESGIGLIAEDVAEVVPEVVSFDNKGEVDGLSYSHLTSLLIEAVKEQQAEIDDLKAALKNLEEGCQK